MSEFFKALEQAERDRARENQAETASAPPSARTTPGDNGTPPAETVVVEPVAVKQAAAEPMPATPAVAKPAVPEPPVARTAAAKPARQQAAPAKPVPAGPAPSPASVFRPSLRTPDRPRVIGRVNGREPLLVALTDPGSLEADAYRTLRANIELTSDGAAARRVAITSAAGGDGKSTTAANLAVVAAQGGRRVCVVDADLRRPSLHDVFGLSNVDGLALALEQGKPLQAVARPAGIENLSVVVAGHGADETFHDLLTPQRLEKILRESETAFDFVVFDSPPVVVADALNIAAVADGVILVVRAGSIPFAVLQRAIGQVKQVKGRVLGVLLNKADLRASDADSYRYYHAYHSSRSKA